MKLSQEHYIFIISALIAPIWAQNLCTSDDIRKMDVSGCICPSNFPSPPSNLVCNGNSIDCPIACTPAGQSPVTPRSQLSQCYSGCVNANSECNGCYIWFASLCWCLRAFQSGTPTDCIASPRISQGPPQPNQPPSWVVLASGTLITTTELIPGILQLGNAADLDGGFRLGQRTINNQMTRDSMALAMNSVSTRSEEQIHIHLCDSNNDIRDILDRLNPALYATQQPVDLSGLHKSNAAMRCRVAPTAGADVNMGRDIDVWLKQYQGSSDCAQYDVGAAVMTDSNDFSWACIITGHRAAENLFCS